MDVNETLPRELREAGFRTGVAGKWHLTPVEQEAGVENADKAKKYAYAAGFDWAGGFYEHNIRFSARPRSVVIEQHPLSLPGQAACCAVPKMPKAAWTQPQYILSSSVLLVDFPLPVCMSF